MSGEERLRLLLADGRTVTWELDLVSGRLEIDPLVDRWLGRPAGAPPLTAEQWHAARLPIDPAEAQRDIDDCTQGRRPIYEHEARLRRPDGEEMQLIVRGSFARDAGGMLARAIGSATDVTEGRSVAQARRQHEARLRAVMDASLDGILICSEAGEIEAANRVALRLLELGEIELVGRDLATVLTDPGRPGMPPGIWDERHDAVPLRRREQTRALRKDGTSMPVECAIAEARIGPRPVFAVVIRDLMAGARNRTFTPVQGVGVLEQREPALAADRTPLGAVTIERDGTLSSVSEGCLAIAGLEAVVREALARPGAGPMTVQRQGRPVRIAVEVHADAADRGRRHALIRELSGEAPSPAAPFRSAILGDSPAIRKLVATIEQVASGDWTVLIEGETGSGKELAARAIHDASARRQGPFVPVNCAGLTESLLGSQFFGHAKGAFTGATGDLPGLFEAASGGTLFLDEIGDISAEAQKTLLRVLEDRTIRRLGETRPRRIDLRIVSATNRDLARQVSAGAFREDLLYRIRVARVRVPPLRERVEDIPALVQSMLARRSFVGRMVSGISPEAMARLAAYSWPGNVRELRSAIEHAVIHCAGREIDVSDLPPELSRAEDAVPVPVPVPVPVAPPRDERARIIEALRRAGGNRSRAARLLGIGRATLYRRLEELDLGSEIDPEGGPGR